MQVSKDTEVEIQRDYYRRTAKDYDSQHLGDDEHNVALSVMLGTMQALSIESVLDLGSGTGRVLRGITAERPDVRVFGIEPVEALREVAYQNGIDRASLMDGDATNLAFEDNQFDLVCAYGLLHHVREPERVVTEMLRVGRKAVFISDANNFGQGSLVSRTLKQAINAVGLWGVANFVKTRGKGYSITQGDGLAYSYSVFNNYRQIKNACRRVHLFNTVDSGTDLYRSAGHVAVLGVR